MAHDVFISHSTQDKVVADAVCAALEAEKIRCWIAPRDIKPGKNWAEAITDALKASKMMVLIFSDHSNQSKQVANELTVAVNAKALVVPFKIEDIPPNRVMEFYLTGAHWLDAMNPPTETQISELVKLVKKALGGELGEPSEAGIYVQKETALGTMPAEAESTKTGAPLSTIKKVGLAAAALLLGGLLVYGGINLFAHFGLSDAVDENGEDLNSALVIPEIGTLIVNSVEDDGEGTLRWALQMAVQDDVITFDPSVFPPDNPQAIYIKSQLPPINRGNLIINASNAGVIIDGGQGSSPDYFAGLTINSSNNIIMGLQILNCRGYHPEYGDIDAGSAIRIIGPFSTNNIIGGDRSVGIGPLGQGNLMAGNSIGVDLQGGPSNNIITGNLIGSDISGKRRNPVYGNTTGVVLDLKTNNNTIGPDNVIAYNMIAISIGENHQPDPEAVSNTVTANSIFDNIEGIKLNNGGNKNLRSPSIIYFSLTGATVRGTSPPHSMVEIFSDKGYQGEIFEGRVQADENGNFVFDAGKRLTGPNITATATDEDGNTSEFSAPAGQ